MFSVDKGVPHCFPKEFQGCYEHSRDLEPTWKRENKDGTVIVINLLYIELSQCLSTRSPNHHRPHPALNRHILPLTPFLIPAFNSERTDDCDAEDDALTKMNLYFTSV